MWCFASLFFITFFFLEISSSSNSLIWLSEAKFNDRSLNVVSTFVDNSFKLKNVKCVDFEISIRVEATLERLKNIFKLYKLYNFYFSVSLWFDYFITVLVGWTLPKIVSSVLPALLACGWRSCWWCHWSWTWSFWQRNTCRQEYRQTWAEIAA